MATQHKPTGCARLFLVLLLVLPLTYLGASYYTSQDPLGVWKLMGVTLGIPEAPTAPQAPTAPEAPIAPSAAVAPQAPANATIYQQELDQMKQELNFLRREVDLLKDEVKLLREKSSKSTY
jgi:hypothetical protein